MSQEPLPLLQQSRIRPARALAATGLFVVLAAAALWGGLYGVRWYHLRAAAAARERKDYAAEHEHLLACLKLGGASADLYLQAARSARRLGSFSEAERFLKQCERLQGPTWGGDLEKILVGIQSGNVSVDQSVVLDYWRQAPEGEPAVPELLDLVSQAYIDRYDLADANMVLDLWVERDPTNAKPILARGWVLQQRSLAPQRAIPDYQRAVELEPANTLARLRLAEALVVSGQVQEALPHLEVLERQRPDDPLVLVNGAQAQRELGNLEEARRLLDLALAPDKLRLVEALATSLRAAQPPPPVIEQADWYRGVMAEVPFNIRGEPSFVIDLYTRALVERARVAAPDGQDAEEFLREAIKLDPFDPQALYQLGLRVERHGSPEEAASLRARLSAARADQERLDSICAQVVDNPHDPEPRCAAAEIMLRIGRPRQAQRWLLTALRERPGDPAALRLMAQYEKLARDRRGGPPAGPR